MNQYWYVWRNESHKSLEWWVAACRDIEAWAGMTQKERDAELKPEKICCTLSAGAEGLFDYVRRAGSWCGREQTQVKLHQETFQILLEWARARDGFCHNGQPAFVWEAAE